MSKTKIIFPEPEKELISIDNMPPDSWGIIVKGNERYTGNLIFKPKYGSHAPVFGIGDSFPINSKVIFVELVDVEIRVIKKS